MQLVQAPGEGSCDRLKHDCDRQTDEVQWHVARLPHGMPDLTVGGCTGPIVIDEIFYDAVSADNVHLGASGRVITGMSRLASLATM